VATGALPAAGRSHTTKSGRLNTTTELLDVFDTIHSSVRQVNAGTDVAAVDASGAITEQYKTRPGTQRLWWPTSPPLGREPRPAARPIRSLSGQQRAEYEPTGAAHPSTSGDGADTQHNECSNTQRSDARSSYARIPDWLADQQSKIGASAPPRALQPAPVPARQVNPLRGGREAVTAQGRACLCTAAHWRSVSRGCVHVASSWPSDRACHSANHSL